MAAMAGTDKAKLAELLERASVTDAGLREHLLGVSFGCTRQLSGFASSWSGASSPSPTIRLRHAAVGLGLRPISHPNL